MSSDTFSKLSNELSVNSFLSITQVTDRLLGTRFADEYRRDLEFISWVRDYVDFEDTPKERGYISRMSSYLPSVPEKLFSFTRRHPVIPLALTAGSVALAGCTSPMDSENVQESISYEDKDFRYERLDAFTNSPSQRCLQEIELGCRVPFRHASPYGEYNPDGAPLEDVKMRLVQFFSSPDDFKECKNYIEPKYTTSRFVWAAVEIETKFPLIPHEAASYIVNENGDIESLELVDFGKPHYLKDNETYLLPIYGTFGELKDGWKSFHVHVVFTDGNMRERAYEFRIGDPFLVTGKSIEC